MGTTVLDTDPDSKAAAEIQAITEETLQFTKDAETSHV